MTDVLLDIMAKVEGHISFDELELLFGMASECSEGSSIVEIGSYKARSTIALALGAKELGAVVYAVDSHPTYEAGGVQFSMADNQAYYVNLALYEVGDVVKTINLPSDKAWLTWRDPIALLFVDGSHEYQQVHRDFMMWSMFTDTVLLHDTSGHHEGVTRLLNEVLAEGEWTVTKTVDSISMLERVKPE